MMRLASGHTVEALQGEELERQKRDFKGYVKGLVRLNPGRWLFPSTYTKFADRLYDFKFRKSDVVVMTWPKCGTTWTQEIIWTMRNNPDLDDPEAKISTHYRIPYIEVDTMLETRSTSSCEHSDILMANLRKACPDGNPNDGMTLQLADAMPGARTLKTHLPFSLLNPRLLDTSKVVCVMRNPKDVVVSYHHQSRLFNIHTYVGSFDQFVRYFVDDDLLYGPYWLHVKEVWEKRDHPNLHIIFYEDLSMNNMAELQKLNDFLGTNLTGEQLQKIAKYTSFGEMKAREEEESFLKDANVLVQDTVKSDGGFFRKGVVGNWKQRLSPDHQVWMDQWMERNTKDFDFFSRYSS
ncbi:sulfotransferase 1C4-like [Panulirus ornatus]|uniref:sulfotransferase 1C4-like n=1 Tax=Panulirus ornatus TaxID=150431 RepID=UPI003A89C42F